MLFAAYLGHHLKAISIRIPDCRGLYSARANPVLSALRLRVREDPDSLMLRDFLISSTTSVQLFVLRIEMRSDANARARAIIDQKIAARQAPSSTS